MSALRTVALGAAGQLSLGSLFVRLTLDSAHFVRGWSDAEATMTGASKRMTAAVVGMTAGAGLAIAGMAALSVREAARFEQSFAGVRRTVEATQEQFAELSNQFRQMAKEIPVNVNEINRIGESAGALGIPIQDIKEFTRVMAMLGSTTNMSSDQAAVSLARIANIMDISGEGFARMGATVLALGQSTVATESEIVEMGKRIAGAGNIVGLTTAQVLGLAAAFASVGVRAEAGGTAMSQVLIRMSKAVEEGGYKLRVFADIAGMTGSEFQKLFRDDAGQAIIAFLEGMKQLDESGGDVFKMLEDLQIDGARVTAILLQAAGAGNKLTEWMNVGTRAWEENTALVKAAEERYKTFISQLTITWNIIRDILITIGNELIPVLKALNSMLQDSLKDTSNLNDGFSGFVNNVAPAFIYVIKQIGDILYGWRLIIKSGEVAFLGFGALVLGVFTKISQTIADHWAGIINTIGAGIDKVIAGINLILPKAQELSKLDLNIKATLPESLVAAAEGTKQAFEESRKELEALSAKGQFSDRFEKEYKKVTAVVKEENTKVVEDVKKTSEEVVRTLAPMSDRLRGALAQLEGLTAKEIEGPKLGADLNTTRGGALRQFEDPAVETMTRLAEERRLAEENLALLMELDQMEIEMTEAMQQKKLELIEAYTEKLKALQLAQAELIFSTSSTMFDDLSSIAEAFAGRQSGIFKAMFAASKAFAVAESIIKIQQGIAAAAAMPFPANLAAIASVVAATANIVSTIQSVKLEFAGKREMGGPVSSGKAFLVGESGPEMFVPSSAGNIIPNDQMGSSVRVVINNFTDARPEVTERQEGNERVIEIMIRRAKTEISSEIRDGRGDVSRALESAFGLKRGKA